ncbi:molybdate ABC transporter substrate-binding protein [Pseudanabaena sp. FACHB-2040]|uniref:molybdate ABC transporter substrate-binding protein n=1 Tax=Pseudanabaena sp. FACHB-2040 TaxID=2692859 RepID=UPI001681D733|nr:molybdate ABC transporter substrate-binding protein [Pseudanabaena sp. FACHB-2040]MBD2260946.1 molybdate ABC transporter substrate-binding protein [Pseudanabaena sp. FACHB-2040]
MKKRHLLTFLAGVGVAIALSFYLRLSASAPVAADRTALLVSAAASLQEALQDIQPLFEEAHPGVMLTYNFGASGALQQQIEQGAPADVFVSAATAQMDTLAQKGLLLPESRRDLLGNQLVLVVPQDSALNLTNFAQLADSQVRRIAVGEFRSVPAGQYAEQVLTNLGVLAQVQPKLVFANNVRGVLSAVESGNVDAGIVYTTDAKISERVREVAIAPTTLHTPITYPAAIVNASRTPTAARDFLEFLVSDSADKVFEEYGFTLMN